MAKTVLTHGCMNIISNLIGRIAITIAICYIDTYMMNVSQGHKVIKEKKG